MTIEGVKQLAQESIKYGVDQLCSTGEVMQMFHLILCDGSREIIACAGDVTNDDRAKYKLSLAIKARVALGDIEAIVMLSDIWYAEFENDAASQIAYRRGLSVSAAHDLGLCNKKEALAAVIETPIYAAIVYQKYHRESGKVVLDGEPDWKETGTVGGRFAGYWPKKEKDSAN